MTRTDSLSRECHQRPRRRSSVPVGAIMVSLLTLLLLVPSGPTAPVPASAQSPTVGEPAGEDPLALTLEEAFRLAIGSNPSYRQTSNDLELNHIQRREAWLSLLPQPNVTLLSTSMNWQRQTVAEDPFGHPLPNPETAMVQTSRSFQEASLNLSLNLSNFLNLRDQETQAELREVNVAREYHELEADVTQAFLDAQERILTVELEEELLESREANRDLAQRLYRLAQRERTDLLEAELDRADQENALEDARFEYRNTLLSLRNLIGDPDLHDFYPVEIPVRVFDPSHLDEEALVAFALDRAPPVIQHRSTIETARRDVTRGRAEWLPTVNLHLNTSRQEFLRESGEAFMRPAPDGGWDRNVGVTVSFPDIGQYFNRQNTSRTRQISLANAEEQLRAVRMELDQDVRTQVVGLRSAHRSVRLQDRRVALAMEQLELRFESYRLGRSDFLQLQQATENAAQARRQALQARFAFERARIGIERALGIPLEVPDEAYVDSDDGEGSR